jgi:putative peptidoglycan lipid II flippase
MSRAAEFALALTLPAAVALAVVPGPVVSVLFERGAFSASDAVSTAAALAVFAFGLPAFVLQKVVQPAYFSREDTVTPLKFAVASMLANTALSVGLAPVIGYLAIPIGTSVAGWVNILLLQRGARRFGVEATPDERLRRRGPRIALASLIMGAAVWAGSQTLAPAFADPGLRIPALILLVAGGAAVYTLTGRLCGAFAIGELLRGLKRRP